MVYDKIVMLFVNILLCLLHSTQAQYTQLTRNTAYCDGESKTALVEHFFSLIFTEFHSTPPVCVCVQICIDQSTYCYPNGCSKRNPKKITNEPQSVSRIQDDNARAQMFLVDKKNDYMDDFMRRQYTEESGTDAKTKKKSIKDIRPDPFKDKYKALFSYKKTPQVEVRYNLREQVKNTKTNLLKSENVDVLKSRWPMKKNSRTKGHTLAGIYDTMNPVTKSNKFFIPVLPDKDVVNYPPRYKKRELKKEDDTKFGMETIYIVNQTNKTLQNTSFSIANLINDLIGNNFETYNEGTNIEENNKMEIDTFNTTFKANLQNHIVTDNITANNVIVINLTSINLDRNKNIEAFNEMIAELSSKIDIQNNTSLEMMRRVSGGIEAVQVYDIGNELIVNKTIYTEATGNTTKNEVDTKSQGIVIVKEDVRTNGVKEDFSLVNVSISLNEDNRSKKSKQKVRSKLQHKKSSGNN